MAKWLKAGVCKTSIRRFESARRLQQFRYELPHFSRLVMVVDMLVGTSVGTTCINLGS